MNLESVMEYVNRMARDFRPEAVILFGSMALGRATPDSDVDLLVVMDRKGNAADSALEIRRRIPRAFPLDLIAKTPGEVRRAVRERDGFICSVLEQGKKVYEKRGKSLAAKSGWRFGLREAGIPGAEAKRPNWDSACFHAQQAIEKCLKAALESWNERIGKVHDLTVLLAACLKRHPEWELMRDDMELLSQYAVTFRYPGADATREQARLAVKAMERCRRIIAGFSKTSSAKRGAGERNHG